MSSMNGSAPPLAAMFVSISCFAIDAHAVQQVTVTGERITTAPGVDAARAEAARVPGGASIVDKEDYADGRASTLLDMFALTPGVLVQPRFGAEESRLSIRGSGLQRTFHLRGIYLLQDGVPLTLADGSGDFQAVEPMALAYTEVLRGANALQYGGANLGGSINFVSPSGRDGKGLRPRLEGGSFGYRRAFASFGNVVGASDYFVSVSSAAQDGFRDWSEQKSARLFGDVGFRWTDRSESRLYFAALHSDSQLPGSLARAQLEADPTAANAGNLAGRQKRDYDLYRLAGRTVWDLESDSLELSFGYSSKDLWHPIFQLLQQRSDDYVAGLRYVGERDFAGHENRWVAGLTPSWNTLKDDRFVNVGGQPGARTGNSSQRSRNLAAYLENQFSVTEQWTVVAGAQWTRAERRLDDRFLSNGDQGLDTRYSRLSPKLGFLWQSDTDWTVFGNLSDSFEPPSFGELAGGVGVDLLDAQRARTAEIGTRGSSGRWQWDVSAYSARVRGELLSLNTPTGQPLGTVNAARTVHRGMEGGFTLALVPALSLRSSFLLNDFRFDGHPTYGDNSLPGIPDQLYRSELAWEFRPGYTLALNGEWSPQRYAVDMAHSWFAEGHALLGAKLTRTAATGLSWFVEGRNLADRRYAATTGVIADANGQDVAQFLPGDGRALYVGLEWRRP